MRLTIDILLYELSRFAVCRKYGNFELCPAFAFPEPLLEDTVIQKEVLYMSAPSDFSEQTEPGTYVCAGKPLCLPKKQETLIIWVEGVSWGRLIQIVTSVFKKYADWDTALLEALNNAEPLNALVKCSEPIFGNHLSVMDRDFHLLVRPYMTTEESAAINLSEADENGFLPLETVNYFKADPYFNELNYARGAFLYSGSISPVRFNCINLFRNNEYIARLVILEMNPFRSFDGVLLEHLARYMEPCFSFQGVKLMADLRGLRGTLLSLLEGIGEYSVTEADLSLRGWSSKDTYLWLHLLETELDINNRTSRYTCIQIETLFPQSCAVQWSGGISVLVNLTSGLQNSDMFQAKFDEFAVKGRFRTGVSNIFTGTEIFAACHQQAVIAASFGKERLDKWLFRFEDFAVDFIIKNGIQQIPPKLCCHPAVQLLYAYDARNDTEYVKTLRCYLENQMNVLETSRQLFIHRSTLIYRSNRIKELTGIDWGDKELVFYLMLSLKILEKTKIS